MLSIDTQVSRSKVKVKGNDGIAYQQELFVQEAYHLVWRYSLMSIIGSYQYSDQEVKGQCQKTDLLLTCLGTGHSAFERGLQLLVTNAFLHSKGSNPTFGIILRSKAGCNRSKPVLNLSKDYTHVFGTWKLNADLHW